MKNSSSAPVEKTFDEKFAECFVKFAAEDFCEDIYSLKRLLLTAPIRTTDQNGGNVTPSLIVQSMRLSFSAEEIAPYDSDEKVLNFYLKNLDQIQSLLLKKISQSDKTTEDEKTILITEAEKTFATLQNLKIQEPRIFLDAIIYDQKAERSFKIISSSENLYYGDAIITEEVTELTYTKNGNGVYVLADGSKYQGNFVNDLFHGQGIYSFVDGDNYEGDFVNGKFHGQGTFTFENGNKYKGDFVNGLPNGQGIYTWADGGEYKGEFIDGKQDGEGTYTDKNGCYTGTFKNGKRDGQGTYTWKNNYKYEGTFLGKQVIGEGILRSPDGEITHYNIKEEEVVYITNIEETFTPPNTSISPTSSSSANASASKSI